MPTPYPELPADEFSWADDWKEAVDNTAPGAAVDMTAGQQEATLTGYVPFAKERDALKKILGYSYADTASPWKLHRVPPQRHPRYPQLVAYAASGVGMQPVAAADGNGNTWAKTASPFDPTNYYANYAKSLLTVRFKSFGRTRFLPDDDPTVVLYEQYRYTTVLPTPAIKTLQRQGGSILKFAEGTPASAGPGSTPITFQADLPELVPEANLIVRWYGVPHEFVSSDASFLFPTKILNLLGCVNSSAFYSTSFATGTCLLMSATFADTLFPVVTTDPNDPATGYDIEFGVLYNPRTSSAGTSKAGHQLFPWWAQGEASGGPYWANATRADGKAYLKEANLNTVFTHAQAP